MLYFFLTVLALSAAATVANIKIRYDAKIPQFAIFGTRVIYVFYSIFLTMLLPTRFHQNCWASSGCCEHKWVNSVVKVINQDHLSTIFSISSF